MRHGGVAPRRAMRKHALLRWEGDTTQALPILQHIQALGGGVGVLREAQREVSPQAVVRAGVRGLRVHRVSIQV